MPLVPFAGRISTAVDSQEMQDFAIKAWQTFTSTGNQDQSCIPVLLPGDLGKAREGVTNRAGAGGTDLRFQFLHLYKWTPISLGFEDGTLSTLSCWLVGVSVWQTWIGI